MGMGRTGGLYRPPCPSVPFAPRRRCPFHPVRPVRAIYGRGKEPSRQRRIELDLAVFDVPQRVDQTAGVEARQFGDRA